MDSPFLLPEFQQKLESVVAYLKVVGIPRIPPFPAYPIKRTQWRAFVLCHRLVAPFQDVRDSRLGYALADQTQTTIARTRDFFGMPAVAEK
jgi:hypothetical protein